MCVSHAQISYFHCPYLMERMQNGGSGSTVSDRAFMSCVEEISPQWYNVGLKQVMKSLDAGHPLEDKLAKIRPSVTEEEVDSIGEEETTVMIISARKDALLVLKESMEGGENPSPSYRKIQPNILRIISRWYKKM